VYRNRIVACHISSRRVIDALTAVIRMISLKVIR